MKKVIAMQSRQCRTVVLNCFAARSLKPSSDLTIVLERCSLVREIRHLPSSGVVKNLETISAVNDLETVVTSKIQEQL